MLDHDQEHEMERAGVPTAPASWPASWPPSAAELAAAPSDAQLALAELLAKHKTLAAVADRFGWHVADLARWQAGAPASASVVARLREARGYRKGTGGLAGVVMLMGAVPPRQRRREQVEALAGAAEEL